MCLRPIASRIPVDLKRKRASRRHQPRADDAGEPLWSIERYKQGTEWAERVRRMMVSIALVAAACTPRNPAAVTRRQAM